MDQGACNYPWKYVKGNACKWCAYIASFSASRMPAFPVFNTLLFHTGVDLATLSYQCTIWKTTQGMLEQLMCSCSDDLQQNAPLHLALKCSGQPLHTSFITLGCLNKQVLVKSLPSLTVHAYTISPCCVATLSSYLLTLCILQLSLKHVTISQLVSLDYW